MCALLRDFLISCLCNFYFYKQKASIGIYKFHKLFNSSLVGKKTKAIIFILLLLFCLICTQFSSDLQILLTHLQHSSMYNVATFMENIKIPVLTFPRILVTILFLFYHFYSQFKYQLNFVLRLFAAQNKQKSNFL